jgi:anthranilate synthase component 2
MNALLIDAYDSFVYIINQYLQEAGVETEVVRNDAIDIAGVQARHPDFIVLGPGPGHPADAGYVEIIRHAQGRIPLLGVCLGHQAIGLAYGGTVARATHLMHGKSSIIEHDGRGCFRGLENNLSVTRYHSLVVQRHNLPTNIEITATALDDEYIMGFRHTRFCDRVGPVPP